VLDKMYLGYYESTKRSGETPLRKIDWQTQVLGEDRMGRKVAGKVSRHSV